MLRVRVCGVRVCFDFSFFAVLGLFFAFDNGGYGWLCFIACICHELGHIAVMTVTGEGFDEIIFSGGGICIKQLEKPSAVVLAAGCVVNFLLFVIFFAVLGRGNIFYTVFGGANLFVGIFNLMPINGLDGHGLLEKVLFCFLSFYATQRIMKAVEIFFGLLLVLGAALLFLSGLVNLTAIIVMIYIFALDFIWKLG